MAETQSKIFTISTYIEVAPCSSQHIEEHVEVNNTSQFLQTSQSDPITKTSCAPSVRKIQRPHSSIGIPSYTNSFIPSANSTTPSSKYSISSSTNSNPPFVKSNSLPANSNPPPKNSNTTPTNSNPPPTNTKRNLRWKL